MATSRREGPAPRGSLRTGPPVYRAAIAVVNSVTLGAFLCLAVAAPALARPEDGLEGARSDEARLALTIQLIEEGRLEEAEAEIDAAGPVAGRDARWLNLQGLVRAGQGDAAGAVRAYETGLRSDPSLAALHRNLAISLVELGVRGRALSEFAQATEIDPRDVEAWLGLCTLQTRLRRYGGARTSLERLELLAPEDLRTGWIRAEIAEAAGEEEERREAWEWLESRAPDAETARRLGALASTPEDALQRYRDCVERDALAVDCREQATRLAYVLGDAEGAVAMSEPALAELSEAGYQNLLVAAASAGEAAKIDAWAVARPPASAGGWLVVASARRDAGRPDGALEAVRAGLGLAESADLYNLLGVLRVEAGDPAAARTAWERALELDPGHGPAAANLREHPGRP